MNFNCVWFRRKRKRLLFSLSPTVIIEIWRNSNELNNVNFRKFFYIPRGDWPVGWGFEVATALFIFALFFFIGAPLIKVLIRTPLIKKLQLYQVKTFVLSNLPRKGKQSIFLASQKLITPFSGFILSSYYMSEEIDRLGLTWLNRKAERIKAKGLLTLEKGQIIYCQVDQLDDFLQHFIPRITSPYILITGKDNLPGLIETVTVNSILKDSNLVAWFSQNQIYDHLPIRPFPFGVRLENAPSVLALMNSGFQNKSDEIYTPFATKHIHLFGSALEDREFIEKYMDSKKPLDDYLKKVQHYRFIVSPAGDRPDTYRHWESIALGSIPISKLPKNFKNLFREAALLVDNYDFLADGLIPANNCFQNNQLVLIDYWKRQLEDCRRSIL